MTDIVKSITETTTEYLNEYADGFITKYFDDNEDGKAIIEKFVKLWSKSSNQQAFVDHMKFWKDSNEAFFQSKKSKGKKRGPKKNKSAYIIFGQHIRQTIKEEHPDWNPKEISREMGKRWNAIKGDKSLTEKYDELAKEDKNRYLTEKENYVPEDDEEDEIHKLKDKNRPKRPLSAYMFFCQDKRNSIKSSLPEGSHAKDVATELGKQWNEIKTNEKKTAKYVKKAIADKERYLEEMKTYVEPSQEELQTRLDDEKAEKSARRAAKKKPSESKKVEKKTKTTAADSEKTRKVKDAKQSMKTADIKNKIASEKKKINNQKKRVVEEDFDDVIEKDIDPVGEEDSLEEDEPLDEEEHLEEEDIEEDE